MLLNMFNVQRRLPNFETLSVSEKSDGSPSLTGQILQTMIWLVGNTYKRDENSFLP